MTQHFAIKPKFGNADVTQQLGIPNSQAVTSAPEDDEDDSKQGPPSGDDNYEAVLTNGMIRTNCSYNSALNIQFQGLASYGGKCALWNLMMAGFGDRLMNWIHDEVVYWLWPEELETLIPVVEDCMIRGMRVATPHVKVGVETCCMKHWDKHAQEWPEIQRLMAETGKSAMEVIEEPPYVKEVLADIP